VRWLLVLTLGWGLLAAPAAGEDAPMPEGWAYEVAGELMSPFCPGRTLADCPSQAAKSLVMWLVVQEAAGRSRAEVEDELYERYGDVLRPAPEARGFGLTAYLIPVAVFAAGGLGLFVFLRRQTRRAAVEPEDPSELDPELARIVDREIAG
jgi:cytochrome c-type biogenesis protein CcmH